MLRVDHRGTTTTYAAGTLCPDPRAGVDAPCVDDSIFDLASLTKLATTAVALLLVRERAISLDMPLRELVPDFRGGAKDRVTLAQVLTHNAGLVGGEQQLWRTATSRDELIWLAAQTPLAHDPGPVLYSDFGYIMLTQGLEVAGGAQFADLVRERVAGAVGAETLEWSPRPPERCAATEDDRRWRGRRLRGEVHDENAFAMGGAAGQAGLFGAAADVAALGRVYRDGAVIGNELATLARREHARGDNVRRGLGLMLKAPEGANCGRHFSVDAYGHTGFTGTSLWIDPRTDLSVVLLTNRVYFGRDNDAEVYRFRIAVHEAVSAPPAT